MLSFWDRVWAIHAMNVRDYYKEREAQRKKWADFCQKCTEEIIDECSNIANLISDAVSNDSVQMTSNRQITFDMVSETMCKSKFLFLCFWDKKSGI